MPSRLNEARASRVLMNGALRKVIGTDGLALDQLPIFLNSGLVNLYGGASGNLINFLMPFDYKAIGAYVINTVNPGTAAATVGVGTTADTDGILDDYSIATNEATTFNNLTANAVFTGAALFGTGSQGDIIVFQTNGNATSTGRAIWGITVVPN